MEPIATVMRRRKLEWLRPVKRRETTENIRAIDRGKHPEENPGWGGREAP